MAPSLVCLAAPALALSQAFVTGITEHPRTAPCDGWAYMAYSRYIWEYPREPRDGLPHVYQFGAAVSHQRWLASSLLGFLSPLVRAGDAACVAGLLQAWSLFNLACAVYLFCAVDGLAPVRAVAVTGFTALGGWAANLVWANNFDNGLALAYMPALASCLVLPRAPAAGKWALYGCSLAAVFYTYPECAALIVAAAGLIALPRFWADRGQWRGWLWGLPAALALAAVVSGPGARDLLCLVRDTVNQAQAPPGQRPGEQVFAGLMDPAVQPAALWGLGGESIAKPHAAWMNTLALVLTACLALGLLKLFWERRWGLALTTVGLLAGAAYMLCKARYDYGTYKFLALSWWCVVAVTVAGVSWVASCLPGRPVRVVAVIGLAVGSVAVGYRATRVSTPLWASRYNSIRFSEARPLRSVARSLRGEPLLLCIDDWLPNLLAVYYLGDQSFYLGGLRSFLGTPTYAPTMARALAPPLDRVKYVLTDAAPERIADLQADGRLVWSRGHYRLWKPDPGRTGAVLCGVENAVGGVQCFNGGRCFWLADTDTVLFLMAARAGTVHLTATFLASPHAPGSHARTVRIQSPAGSREETVALGPGMLALPVQAGMNRIVLRGLGRATLPCAPYPQPLLLGIWGFQVKLATEAPGSTARGSRETTGRLGS